MMTSQHSGKKYGLGKAVFLCCIIGVFLAACGPKVETKPQPISKSGYLDQLAKQNSGSKFANEDLTAPWNDKTLQDDPTKPWNNPAYAKDPEAPWNQAYTTDVTIQYYKARHNLSF